LQNPADGVEKCESRMRVGQGVRLEVELTDWPTEHLMFK